MSGYFARMKRWLKTHRRSRKHAALQNLCCALLLAVIGAVLLRGYAADVSTEAAVRQWCEDNFFGEGDIVAVLEFEEDRHQQKEVTISKELPDGERCDAKIFLYRQNPWKWVYSGSSYFAESIDYTVDPEHIEDWGNDIYRFTRQEDLGMFPELVLAEWVEAAYVPTHVMEGLEAGPGSHISLMVGIQFEESEAAGRGQWHQSQLTYWVNLDSMEVEHTYFEPIAVNGKAAELWISEERMVFIAQKLMDAAPQKQEAVW